MTLAPSYGGIEWTGAVVVSLSSHVLAIGLVLGGTSSAQAQLRPEPDAIKLAPRELIDRLRANPTDYFRFVNRPWIARVCEVFAADLPNVPIVRLHGDAHIEQFAVTEDAWGLDDFDDSARGPALVDIVRFLGSVDIALRRRDWIRSREAVFDRFFAGYRRGLAGAGLSTAAAGHRWSPTHASAAIARGVSRVGRDATAADG